MPFVTAGENGIHRLRQGWWPVPFGPRRCRKPPCSKPESRASTRHPRFAMRSNQNAALFLPTASTNGRFRRRTRNEMLGTSFSLIGAVLLCRPLGLQFQFRCHELHDHRRASLDPMKQLHDRQPVILDPLRLLARSGDSSRSSKAVARSPPGWPTAVLPGEPRRKCDRQRGEAERQPTHDRADSTAMSDEIRLPGAMGSVTRPAFSIISASIPAAARMQDGALPSRGSHLVGSVSSTAPTVSASCDSAVGSQGQSHSRVEANCTMARLPVSWSRYVIAGRRATF